MNNINSLRAVFRLLDQHNIQMDYYAALDFADQIVRELVTTSTDSAPALRYIAAHDAAIQLFYQQRQKISAIKELRTLTSCGLKEAKDAVEHVYGTDWSRSTVDYDAALAELREKLSGE